MTNNKDKVVALGSFDGLHLGHKKVILETIKLAKNMHIESLLFNIDKNNTKRLIKIEDKKIIAQKMGINVFINIELNKISHIDGYDFIKNFIVNQLKAKIICCGFNYRFGNGAKYNVKDLKTMCHQLGISLYIVPPLLFKETIISSSKIRSLIENGNMRLANSLLGYNFFINFKVNNIKVFDTFLIIIQHFDHDFIVPKLGFYSSIAHANNNNKYDSYTEIKFSKSNNKLPIAETKIFNCYNKNLLNKNIKIEFLSNN